MGKKSRHFRDESDPLLGFYSATIAASSSENRSSNPLYTSERVGVPNIHASPQKSTRSYWYDDPVAQDMTPKRYRVHRVSYTAGNHIQVLFQMYGSAFPNVLPFCIANVLWTLLVEHLKRQNIIDLTFHSSVGHSFMGLLVSFLVVSRSKISYDRFMNFRRLLATQYRACRELAQYTAVYTMQTQTPQAREWRQEVCFKTIVLLRLTMDTLLWSSTEREQWEEEYFKYRSKTMPRMPSNDTLDSSDIEGQDEGQDDGDGESDKVSEHFFRFRKLSHGRRSNVDENFRGPITYCHLLKQTIMTHPDYLGYKLAVNEYRDLLNFVSIFQEAFHGFRVLVFTPYPFPLVQMTRAFLFFWVYTLPMVLLKDYRLMSSLLIVLLVSFGFIGIEYVSMALDDPFGDETNDVDEHGMALLVYEDVYLAIYRTDGPNAAFALRDRVLKRYEQGRGIDCYRDDMKGYAIWEPIYHPKSPEKSTRPTMNGVTTTAPSVSIKETIGLAYKDI